MSCINKDILQKYIDGETTPNESKMIETHLDHCEYCAARLESQKRLIGRVIDAMNMLAEDHVEIPKFEMPERQPKRFLSTGRKLIYSISAACILLFVLFVPQVQKPERPMEVIIVQDFECDVDANLPISQQEFVINVIDSEGNTKEYLIE